MKQSRVSCLSLKAIGEPRRVVAGDGGVSLRLGLGAMVVVGRHLPSHAAARLCCDAWRSFLTWLTILPCRIVRTSRQCLLAGSRLDWRTDVIVSCPPDTSGHGPDTKSCPDGHQNRCFWTNNEGGHVRTFERTWPCIAASIYLSMSYVDFGFKGVGGVCVRTR